MSQQTLVSLITPMFNREQLIQETIKSVQAQAYANWEHIIVDDGSTDQSVELVKQLAKQDSRIKIYKRKSDVKGANSCRNEALEYMKGNYFMFLDSDDLLTEHCLEKRLKFVADYPDYDLWTFPSLKFTEQNQVKKFGDLFYFNDLKNDLFSAFLFRPQWPVNGSFIDSKTWHSNRIYYHKHLYRWQDWDFHLRLIISGYRVKRHRGKEADVLLRQHYSKSRISEVKTISKQDMLAIVESLNYILSNVDPKNMQQIKAAKYRIFFFFEMLLHKRSGKLIRIALNHLHFPKQHFTAVERSVLRLSQSTPSWFLLQKIWQRLYYELQKDIVNLR